MPWILIYLMSIMFPITTSINHFIKRLDLMNKSFYQTVYLITKFMCDAKGKLSGLNDALGAITLHCKLCDAARYELNQSYRR